MGRPRSIFAGDTDYTGVSLNDIREHFRGWRDGLSQDVIVLGNIRKRLVAYEGGWRSRDGAEFIDSFVDLFTRYIADLDRLLSETTQSVRPRHVEIVRQMYESSYHAEQRCVGFKRRHYLDALRETDKVQNTLAEVYRLTRDAVIDLRDLSNVLPRLDTFVSAASEHDVSSTKALELKPNFYGIGLNLNHVIDRLVGRYRRWRHSRSLRGSP